MMIQPMNQDIKFENTVMNPKSAMSFLIKCSGTRPLSFDGTELGMAMSFVPSASYWYEINIYKTVSDTFVICIRIFFQSEDERDMSRAWEFQGLDQVMDKLESYDAANDVRVSVDPEDPSMSLADLAAAAFVWRARAKAARQQFEGLVGEILYDLSQAD